MEYQNKVKSCLTFLKEHIKQSDQGYQQLADRLGISLLTVKRQLNGDEISMTKLLGLCDAAQMSFSELWQKVEERKPAHTVFTQEQDRAFYNFPHLFRYFIELNMAKQTPDQIQEQWGISGASTHLYLRKLEKLGLVSLSEKGNPTVLVSEPLGFSGDSLNFRKGVQSALREVSEKVMRPGEGDGTTFVLAKPMILPEEMRERMYQEITEMVSGYAELSERYFIESGHPAYELVVCDYKMGEGEPLPEIMNVTDFSTEKS